jgi:primosomal protein N' (replication factor Y)
VSGRAGREREQGQVIIQTAFPTHPFWADIMHGGYEKFVQRELAERERALWPPFAHLALLRTAASKRRDAHDLLERMRDLAAARQSDGVRVLGPVSAPMERRAGRYRAQLLLQSRDRRRLHELTGHLRTALDDDAAARRMRWSIDIDPIELF